MVTGSLQPQFLSMIPLLSSNVFLVSFPLVRNLANSPSPTHFTLRFNFAPISQTRLFSSSIDVAREIDKDESFTVSYLINSCGLSPESAKLASKSKLVQFKDPSKPDSVLDCLKNYGFSDAHIKRVVRGYPRVLKVDIENNLKPKMEFFLSIGIKGDDLLTILCKNPTLVGYSLNNKLIPCHDFLKRVLVHDELIVKSLKLNSWIFRGNLERNIVPNFELLEKVGVSESHIQIFISRASNLLGIDKSKFSKKVCEVIEMGFDPSKTSFLEAIIRLPSKSAWELKAQVCRSWGWSDSDISSAFMKSPPFMSTSVEKLTAVMEFLVNKMGWDPFAVAAAPLLFSLSLEKNIIPKCSVIKVLQLKGLIGEEITLYSFMACSTGNFLDRFVFGYLEQVPELLDIYEGKLDLSELGFGFEEKLDTKL